MQKPYICSQTINANYKMKKTILTILAFGLICCTPQRQDTQHITITTDDAADRKMILVPMGSNEGPVEIGLYAANVGFNRGHVEVENVAGSSMLVSEKNQHSVGGQYMAPSLVAPREKSHLEHFMPVTVGVTVSRALNGWLSMDSGLLYTNLYSVSKSSGAISNYSMRRTMDFLGVPLALSASFANLGDLSFYGRLGGTVELCINANDKTFVDGVMANKSRLDVPTLTLSFDAALGASYQIVGAVGLFGEVGCSYWKSPADYPENYRTVHPLSLSSRFGLRFTFN